MAGWTAGVTAIFVRPLVPVNGTCLGYGALVNSTTPIRGNGIAKTRAFCQQLAVPEMVIAIIKANTIMILLNSWFEEKVIFTLAGLNYLTPFHIF